MPFPGLLSPNVGAEFGQSGVQGLIATIEMVQAGDDRLALGRESGQDQGGSGPQVGGANRGSRKHAGAADYGALSFQTHVGSETLKFCKVLETLREDRVDHAAGPGGQCEQGRPLGLKVRRHTRIGPGDDVARPGRPVTGQRDAIRVDVELESRGIQLVEDGGQMIRLNAGDGNTALGDRACQKKRGGFDAVGNDAVVRSAELLDAADPKR